MRYAILSDIHSNLEALEAVLKDARALSCSEFVCLGDVVGYNANPSECVARIRELQCPVVKGNHDEQASTAAIREGFNELAEAAIDWTRAHLSAEDKAWLADLCLTKQVGEFTIVHATLDSPGEWDYVFDDAHAIASFAHQQTALCFFGHTHWPSAFVRGDSVRRIPVGQIALEQGQKYFLNPGSIGQPRDRDWRAAYCVYDTDRKVVEQRRVTYDLDTTQGKILAAGLPEQLADRLAYGR